MADNEKTPVESEGAGNENMPDIKTESYETSVNAEDNTELAEMLQWRKGIGHLPGSVLKFRKSEKGSLEVITPDSDEEYNDHSKTNDINGLVRKTRKRKPVHKYTLLNGCEKKNEVTPDCVKRKKKKPRSIECDQVLKCETCGCYGIISEFRSSGRFCSQRCVGAYASRKRAEMIADQFAKGERPMPKSGKKAMRKNKKFQSNGECSDLYGTTCENGSLTHSFIDEQVTLYYSKVGHDKEFDWTEYLHMTNSTAVPIETFLKEYPEQDVFPSNQFQPTMKLECIDPKHQSIICVVSVVEVQGARLRLHFDGWSESYDFWIHCDSYLLRPCGWSKENEQTLFPPRGMDTNTFNWEDYLTSTACQAAPEHLFRKLPSPRHSFCVNMKLEAIDRKNPDLVCVASVNNVVADHFLVHFDEWDDSYDYWCKDDSPYIHPVGWCEEVGITLIPPTDEMINKFVWADYLKETNTVAAPKDIFKPRKEPDFKTDQKLEVIDPRNHLLVRVSTIVNTEEFRIKVHFDGWDSRYDYWFDTDSVDLHPVGWCKNTGHALEPPKSDKDTGVLCGTPGCTGIGHIKGAKYTTHHTSFGCPYTQQNINRSTLPVTDRLAPNALIEEHSIMTRIHNKKTDKLPNPTHNVDHAKQGSGIKRKKSRPRNKATILDSKGSPLKKTQFRPLILNESVTQRPAGRAQSLSATFCSVAVPWTKHEVGLFLEKIGFMDLVSPFKEHEIDGEALLLLSQTDLVRHLKLKLGPALKIYDEISKLSSVKDLR